MENKFNEQESLQLITSMINQARNNFRRGAGNSLLFWGYTLTALSILNYVLLVFFNNPLVYSLWALAIPLFFVNYFYSRKRYREALIKSHIDKVIRDVWTSASVSIALIVFICYSFVYGFKSWTPYLLIVPLIMAVGGTALYITAKLCRFKPYAYGGIVFWLGSILCVISSIATSQIEIQFIVFALGTIAGYVVPGHMANRKAEEDV
ncbi:MAG: hypothetical protein LBU37_05510 [Tannerellaceae bacterium]|jgi:hypothetical protein|nr:hypothetical protein [Tannerellaceae bacterium]